MARYEYPDTISGTQLASKLCEDFKDVLRIHRASSRPSYFDNLNVKGWWIDDSSSPAVLKFYDGGSDFPVMRIDETDDVITHVGKVLFKDVDGDAADWDVEENANGDLVFTSEDLPGADSRIMFAEDATIETQDQTGDPGADDRLTPRGYILDNFMQISVYDSDGNGTVDNAEALGGSSPSEYLDKTTYDSNDDGKVDAADSADDASTLGGKTEGQLDVDKVDGQDASDLSGQGIGSANVRGSANTLVSDGSYATGDAYTLNLSGPAAMISFKTPKNVDLTIQYRLSGQNWKDLFRAQDPSESVSNIYTTWLVGDGSNNCEIQLVDDFGSGSGDAGELTVKELAYL